MFKIAIWVAIFFIVNGGVVASSRKKMLLPIILPNGCLIASFEFEQIIKARAHLYNLTWVKIVRVWYSEKDTVHSHAYCVYAIGNGDLYAYNPASPNGGGSTFLNTRNQSLNSIILALKRFGPEIYDGEFLD